MAKLHPQDGTSRGCGQSLDILLDLLCHIFQWSLVSEAAWNMETTLAWPLEGQLVSWKHVYIINIYIYLHSSPVDIYIYIQSYLPTINGQYQKQLSKDNVIKHTCVVLYIYHAMTCLVTVSGCCFQTKLYIRRVKYKIIQLNLLSFKYYNSN